MKAAFHIGKEQAEIREVDIPLISENECLVKIETCGICGSDTWWLSEGISDRIFGHEIAGIIVEVGKEVPYWRRGDRVVVYDVVGCGNCAYCQRGMDTYCLSRYSLSGGFAEYISVPVRSLLPLPDRIGFEEGSMVSDNLGTPLRGLRRSNIREGDTVTVWGLGPLGLVSVQGAKALGAGQVIGIDRLPNRLRIARELGADEVINAGEQNPVDRLKEIVGRKGVDISISAVNKEEAAQMAYDTLKLDGTLVTLAGSFKPQAEREVRVTGSWYFLKSEYRFNLEFVLNGNIKLKPIITHIFPLEQINEAFQMRFKQQEKSLKVIVKMGE